MDMEWSMKLLKQGFNELNVVEWIRYPLFSLWLVLMTVVGVFFVADFLASKKEVFAPLAQLKNKVYNSQWASIVIGVLTILVSFMLFIFPAGAVDGFFGDFLPALLGMVAGVFFFLDVYLISKNAEVADESLEPNKFVAFLVKSKVVFGFAFLAMVVLHFFFSTILFL